MKSEGLKESYKKEADKCLENIKKMLSKLKKRQSDKKAMKELSRLSHTLKGDSLQRGFYSVAYLAHLMEAFINKLIEGGAALDKNKLAFLFDSTGSLEKTLSYELKSKKYKVNVKLFKKLDKLMKE